MTEIRAQSSTDTRPVFVRCNYDRNYSTIVHWHTTCVGQAQLRQKLQHNHQHNTPPTHNLCSSGATTIETTAQSSAQSSTDTQPVLVCFQRWWSGSRQWDVVRAPSAAVSAALTTGPRCFPPQLQHHTKPLQRQTQYHQLTCLNQCSITAVWVNDNILAEFHTLSTQNSSTRNIHNNTTVTTY